MEDIRSYIFKIEFDGDLRRFVLGDLAFHTMDEKTREVFVFTKEHQIHFHYKDISGNLVTISTDAHLNGIYASIQTNPKIIRLFIDATLPIQKAPVGEPAKKDGIEKVDQVQEPQYEAAEPEFTPASEHPSSASSTRPKRLTSFEKKKRALACLSSRRARLARRCQNLSEQCERVKQRAAHIAGRLNTVDRRIMNLIHKHPELAASIPELELEELSEVAMDRSRSNLFCDSCDIGILAHSEVHFHCETCGNFDLCLRCERQFGHEHHLLRIEEGTRPLPSFFDLSFDNDVRTLEACCLDVWNELEASGLLCPRNLAILIVISLLSFVMALSTAYAVCSAIFSVA